MSHIDRVDFRRAALQQAIREAAGRSADIERDLVFHFELEMIERAFQLLVRRDRHNVAPPRS